MNVRKISYILFVVALMATPTISSAQATEYEKFDFNSHQVSFGYGFGSANQLRDKYKDISNTGHIYDGNKSWGSVNLTYVYRHSDLITFGMGYTYTGLKRDIYNNTGKLMGDNNIDIHVIMPEFKCDWFKRGIITLYSRGSAGISIARIEDNFPATMEKSTNTEVDFAYQISPIGIEIGNAFAFYAEVGYGYNGIVEAGFRYSF